MANKRDLVAEIEEIRSRRMPGSPLTIPLRMRIIASAFEQSPTLEREFLRYVPIATVACIEGFCRSAIASFIDAGPPFIDNARTLTQVRELRVDLDMLGAVQGQRVSIGELIAHLLPLNNLEQIGAIMSALTGKDFLKSLATVVSRWDTEIEGKPAEPIIRDADAALKHITEMFRLRHIYAHEIAGLDADPERSEIGEALEASVSFLTAAAEFVACLLAPDAPLTQSDMNQRAADDVRATDASIETILNEISGLVNRYETNAERTELLRESQSAWIAFRRAQAKFEAEAYHGGSIYPQIYSLTAGRLAHDRLAYLQRLRERESAP